MLRTDKYVLFSFIGNHVLNVPPNLFDKKLPSQVARNMMIQSTVGIDKQTIKLSIGFLFRDDTLLVNYKSHDLICIF